MSTGKTTQIPDSLNQRVAITSWPALAAGEAGEPFEIAQFSDRSIQIAGTFGGATVTFEGSNDGVGYHTLSDPAGLPLSFSAAGLKAVAELTRWVRPKVAGGDGSTALSATLLARG